MAKFLKQNDFEIDGLPVGSIVVGSTERVPDGFMRPEGQALRKDLYAELNALYSSDGYPYGSDSTTFNLPNYSDPALWLKTRSTYLKPESEYHFDQRLTDIESNNMTIGGEKTFTDETTFDDALILGTSRLETPVGSAPSYTCRAWVNFDGTTTPPTIRASGNVSSVTRPGGAGEYVITFTTPMQDTNYSVIATSSIDSTSVTICTPDNMSWFSTSSIKLVVANLSGVAVNRSVVTVAIYR